MTGLRTNQCEGKDDSGCLGKRKGPESPGGGSRESPGCQKRKCGPRGEHLEDSESQVLTRWKGTGDKSMSVNGWQSSQSTCKRKESIFCVAPQIR